MNTQKTLLFFIIVLLSYSIKAQNLLTEGFENSFPPTGWTILNMGAQPDGETWIQNDNHHSGSYCAFSQDGEEGYVMEEWLITPAITVPANSYIEISFWHMFKWYAYNDGPEYVMISTSGTDPADFTDTVYTYSIVGNADWEQVLLNDIPDYAGQTIYVAFVHTSANGYADAWLLDDISIDAYETGEKDMGVLSINTPTEYSTANIDVYPSATIKNFGIAVITDNFEISCEITNASSNTVYSSSITYTNELAIGEITKINFTDVWTPTEEGIYTVTISISLIGDTNADNNSINAETEVIAHYGTGGADAFGYQWIDSDVEGGPEYNWIEISETGTSTITYGVPYFRGDDNFSEPIDFGFDFPFYGIDRSYFHVDINGEILLADNNWYNAYPYPNDAWNRDGNMFNYSDPIPGNTNMPALVAVYWDDMSADEGVGDIYFQTFGEEPNRYCVVEWHNLRFTYGNAEDTTLCFEAIFHENGDIIYQYKNTSIGHSGSYYPHDNGQSATIGIQNDTYDIGLSYLFEIIDAEGLYHGVEPMGNILHNELAIKFFMGVDEQPPMFTHEAKGNTFDNTPEFSVKLTDMSGILYDSLYYNIGDEWISVAHSSVEADVFYYVLPEMANSTTIKYYFVAIDNSDANNRGTFPANGPTEYNSFNILPTSDDVKIILAYSGSEDYKNTEFPVFTSTLDSINVDYDIYNWEEYDDYRITDNYDIVFLYSSSTKRDGVVDTLSVAMMDFLNSGTEANPKNILTFSDEMASTRHPLPNSSKLNEFYSAYIRGGFNPQVNPPYNGGTDGMGGPDIYSYSEGSIIGVDGSPIGELDVELAVKSNTPDVIRSGDVPSWYEEGVTNPEISSNVAYKFQDGPISGNAYAKGQASAIWLDNLIYKSYFMSFDLSQITSKDDRVMLITDALKWFDLQVNISASVNPAESGTITGDGTFNYGETIDLTATATTGYNFVNWTENGTEVSTDTTYSFTVSKDRTIVANFSDATSVTDIDNNIAFNVYPNPATDIITFETYGKNNFTYKIVNITGAVVMQGVIDENKKQLDISQIPSGVYMISVGDNTATETIRFLKQ